MPQPSTHAPSQADEISRLNTRLSFLLEYLHGPLLENFNNLRTEHSKKAVEQSRYRVQLRTAEQEAESAISHNLMDEHKKKLNRMANMKWLISYTDLQSQELNIKIESKAKRMKDGEQEIVEIQRKLRELERVGH